MKGIMVIYYFYLNAEIIYLNLIIYVYVYYTGCHNKKIPKGILGKAGSYFSFVKSKVMVVIR